MRYDFKILPVSNFQLFYFVKFQQTDPMVGFYFYSQVHTPISNRRTFGAGSKRPRTESLHSSPEVSYLSLPVDALGPLAAPPTGSKPPKRKRVSKRPTSESTETKQYCQTFLQNHAPRCYTLSLSARRDIRHTMLTEEPYPIDGRGYILAEAAYNKVQGDLPDIKPETCAYSNSHHVIFAPLN